MRRQILLVNIVSLLIGISYGMHNPILPIFASETIGATYSEIGAIGVANFAPYIFVPLFVGILLDRFNRGWILTAGVALNAVSTYALSIVHTVPEIMVCRIGTGIAHAFFWPPFYNFVSLVPCRIYHRSAFRLAAFQTSRIRVFCLQVLLNA